MINLLESLAVIVRPNESAHIQVFLDGEGRKDIAHLGHVADALLCHLVGPETGNVLVLQHHFALPGDQNAEDRLQQGGFPCAVGTDDGDDFTGLETEVDTVEDVHCSVTGRDILGTQNGHRYCPPK